jgi:hypothetical protein
MANAHIMNRAKPAPFMIMLKGVAGFGLAALALFAFLAPYVGLHGTFAGQITAAALGGIIGFILARR